MPTKAAPRRQQQPNQTTAVVVREDPIGDVERLMTQKRDQLLDLFGGDEATVDRMRTLTLHALATPKLLEKLRQADLASVIEAIRQCASLGLMPIPALAEGYFVPYWNSDKRKYDIQFQPGYQGLAKLVLNSGRVLDIDAGVAYQGDTFEYEEGSSPFVRHVRKLSDRGDRIAAYAVARLPHGLVKVRVLPISDIELHRRASKSGDAGPWVDWYDPMAAKTALRELTKFLPKSATVERALLLDSELEERYTAPPARVVVGESDARRRLRSPFVPAISREPDQGATGGDGSATSNPPSEPEPAVSGRSSASAPENEVEGTSREVSEEPKGTGDAYQVCGAPSDPALGPVETCVLEGGHTSADGKPSAHQSDQGSRWPNR